MRVLLRKGNPLQKSVTQKIVPIILLSLLGQLAIAAEDAPAAESPAEKCKALESADFTRVPDAPTKITQAKVSGASTDTTAYCQISGGIGSSVKFALQLPLQGWNRKLIEVGRASYQESAHRGYAHLFMPDGDQNGDPASGLQYHVDAAYRAAHLATLAGKAITAHFYGEALWKSYFLGCSAGGRTALMEAQRYPWDFDGIIAAAPSINPTGILTSFLWGNRAFVGATGKPVLEPDGLKALHEAVVNKCDMNDGVRDGLIGDPRACEFKPSTLLCTDNKGPRCLTAEQVAAVQKLYGGPVTSKGQQIFAPAALKGSELFWTGLYSNSDFARNGFRILLPELGSSWEAKDFDFDRDYQRFGSADTLYSAVNPDLRAFKARGGKLLSYTGWADATDQQRTADYYETVERTMGGRAATQDFFRLFVVPGMGHCGGGEGATEVDWLGALEAWVERGEAPQRLVGAHLKPTSRSIEFPIDPASIEFTRPIFPYPTRVKYLGRGDPNDAANFGASKP